MALEVGPSSPTMREDLIGIRLGSPGIFQRLGDPMFFPPATCDAELKKSNRA